MFETVFGQDLDNDGDVGEKNNDSIQNLINAGIDGLAGEDLNNQ